MQNNVVPPKHSQCVYAVMMNRKIEMKSEPSLYMLTDELSTYHPLTT